MVTCCRSCGAEQELSVLQPVKAAYGANDERCWDCRLVVVGEPSPTLLSIGTATEAAYEVADWPAHARVVLSTALADRGIRSRWEPGPFLVVAETDEDIVEELLDELEDEESSNVGVDRGEVSGFDGAGDSRSGPDANANADADADADGDGAQAAMGDLFVAADRLMHEPWDEAFADDLFEATAVVESSRAPFGIAPESWVQITELASVVRDDIDAGADEDVVVQDARTLREVLRRFI